MSLLTDKEAMRISMYGNNLRNPQNQREKQINKA
jgi:hypothetical protein